MIRYQLCFEDGSELKFAFDLELFEEAAIPDEARPTWTELEYHKCTHCTLNDTVSHCPAALALSNVLPRFEDHISYDTVDVTVETAARSYFKKCDVQTALSSILGLQMATSPCPVLSELRSMAAFHLPFATIEETVFRSVGTFLIRSYFDAQDGGAFDSSLDGLRDLYERLNTLNYCFARRVRAAANEDANLNAVVVLATLSALVSSSLDNQLGRLRHRFEHPEDEEW